MKINVNQIVTDRIMDELKKGIIPWHKPWSPNAPRCINYVTRKTYKGINTMLLTRDGEYMTFQQCKEAGGKVKKGAKSEIVVFFTKFQSKETDKNGNPKIIPMLRYYNVFHITDCEGIESKIKGKAVPKKIDIKAGEKIIKDYAAREKADGFTYKTEQSDKAFYSPSLDLVVVPAKDQFDTIEGYYATAFHEITLSTKKASRLNRNSDKLSFFGSTEYSKEELVAEMGSAMLCSTIGIDCKNTFKNSVAYIQSWLKALENDEKMVLWAASRAEKAVNYIINGAKATDTPTEIEI